MMRAQKKKFSGYAAWLLLPAVLSGLYFGAKAIAQKQLSAALQSASELEVTVREGLWNYNFLTAREQYLYDMLSEAMEAREEKTQRVSFVPTQTEFSAAFDAVLCDYPIYCDLIRRECTLVTGDNSSYMTLAYLAGGDARRQALKDAAESMAARASAMTASEFACILNDRIAEQCVYQDVQSAERATAYDAMIACEADSYGYALLYALVCREAGIDCAVVRGSVRTDDVTGAHAWNVLTLDGMTGYTDVMWNDAESGDASHLPFHGYYFLSAEEIGIDHTPMAGLDFPSADETENYYESKGICITDAAALETLLPTLLTDARTAGLDAVEFWLDPALDITDYTLEEAFSAAVDAANAAESDAPHLRHVHRLYRSSVRGGGITVQLFYEENNDQLGES